jgi:predicted nucleic acid-binding protein
VKVLIDTNVILDVLLARKPHVEASTGVLALVEEGQIQGLVGATTITTIHYLCTKAVGRRKAKEHIGHLLSLVEVAPVTRVVLVDALASKLVDYEDAVLHEAGRHIGVDGIVTRDPKGFSNGTLPVFLPEEFLSGIQVLG